MRCVVRAITGDAAQIRCVAERPDVERISPIIAKERMNSGSEIDTKTLATWTRENTGYTGKGVKIAVVDSGVDYTHADFGGPGTVDSYLKAKAMTELPSADSGLIDRNKFIGGIDLVGDDYNASVLRSRLRSRIITRWIAARMVSVLAVTARTWRVLPPVTV